MRKYENLLYAIGAIFGVIFLLIFLPKCNPVGSIIDYSMGTTEITVHICLGPTLQCIAKVPRGYIRQDSLDKYLDIDPEYGLLKANLTSLKIKKRLITISLEAKGYSEKTNSEYRYKKEMALPFSSNNIEELNKDSIVIYLDIGGK